MRLLDQFALSLYRKRLRGAVRALGWLGIGGPHGRRIRAAARYGAQFELDPFDYIDAFVLRDGFYESEVFEAAKAAMPETGVFWDIGANFGLHAVSMALAKPSARVIAFEPSPRELARLTASIALNQVRIQALPIGLADVEGVRKFHICHNNPGRNALGGFEDPDSFSETLAVLSTGDGLIDQGLLPAPNVIKIDVEGAEILVLRGLRKVLARPDCRAIVIEAEPDSDRPDSELRQLLPPEQFRLTRLQRREATGHRLDNFLAERISSSG